MPRIVAIASLLAFEALPAGAADYTRTAASGPFWTTPAAWSPAGVPGVGDRVIFTSTSGALLRINGTQAVGQMVWTGNPAGQTFTNAFAPTKANLLIKGINGVGIDIQSTATAALYNSIGITADQTWRASNVGGGGFRNLASFSYFDLGSSTLTVDLVNAVNTAQLDALHGTGGNLVKTGLGTLTLSGTSDYAGSTTIDSGTVALASNGSIAGTSMVTVNGSGRLDLTATASDTNIARLAGSGSVLLGTKALTLRQANDTFSGTISGGGGLSISSGRETFTGNNTYDGSTRIASGATLQLGDGGASGSVAHGIIDDGTLIFNRSDVVTVANVISGSGEIQQLGSGATDLTADNSGFTGIVNVLAGTLRVSGQLSGSANVSAGAFLVDGVLTGNANLTNGQIVVNGQMTGSASGSAGELIVNGTMTGNANLTNGQIVVNGQMDGSASVGTGTLLVKGALTGDANLTNGQIVVDGQVGGSASVGTGELVVNRVLTGDANLTNGQLVVDGQVGGSATVGTGALLVNGALTGNANLTNGQIVVNGQVGGSASVGTGALLVNGVLTGDANLTNGQVVVNGQVGGSANVRGGGELSVNGKLGGDAQMSAGKLVVNGKIGGAVNMIGGSLSGSGTVGALNVGTGASVAPGNSIGTLSMTSASFSAGSLYAVQLKAGGTVAGADNDLLNIAGKMTIHGGIVQVSPENGTDSGLTYTPGLRYTIARASGGVDGKFDSLVDDYPYLNFSLSYDPTDVYLVSTPSVSTFCLPGMAANACAAANAIFSLPASPLFKALLTLSEAQAPQALDALSGELHASATSALLEDSHWPRDAALNRLHAAFAPEHGVGDGSSANVTGQAASHDISLWGQVLGAWGHWDGNAQTARMNRSLNGFLLGGDARIRDNVIIGVMAGYQNSGLSAGARASSAEVDTYWLGAYGGKQWGPLGFRFGGVYGLSELSTTRNVAFAGFADRLSASYGSQLAQLYGETAYRLDLRDGHVEPFANVAWVNLHTGGFTESGGAAALAVGGQTMNNAVTTVGVRGERALELGRVRMRMQAMAGWRHAFGNLTPLSTARFASGGDAFTVAGVPVAKDALLLEGGFGIHLTRTATLSVSYRGQFGHGFEDQGAKATFAMKF